MSLGLIESLVRDIFMRGYLPPTTLLVALKVINDIVTLTQKVKPGQVEDIFHHIEKSGCLDAIEQLQQVPNVEIAELARKLVEMNNLSIS